MTPYSCDISVMFAMFIMKNSTPAAQDAFQYDPSMNPADSTSDSSADVSEDTSITSEKKKPAWCQSEASHKISEEIAVVNDEADLLDFVDNLDFDQYAEDLELHTMMGQVEGRIKTLEKEKKKDETRLQSVCDVSA